MKIIRSDSAGFDNFFHQLRLRGAALNPRLLASVAKIVQDVAARGDKSLFAYTAKFDGYKLTSATTEVSGREKKEALTQVKKEDLEIIRFAFARIKKYHRRQKMRGWTMSDAGGAQLGQKIVPLNKIGIYAPGGKAFYPSTLLMAAIPAKIAGVKEIIVVSPAKDGKINPLVIAAAKICGVERIFKIGGAQAIAALAYGTQTIPRVDKIVGPGNAYVAAAKKIVFGQVGIDMIAGPSEILIIADDTADASFVAADMLGQAEHDEMAASVLLTFSENFARRVSKEIDKQIKSAARKKIIQTSLRKYGAIIITKDIEQAARLADNFAPEHLELMVKDSREILPQISNAGSVFLGSHTPEALGDYLAGGNHILPTSGTARFFSALGVYDFVRHMSVSSFTPAALQTLALPTIRFAQMEGLEAHAASVRLRTGKK